MCWTQRKSCFPELLLAFPSPPVSPGRAGRTVPVPRVTQPTAALAALAAPEPDEPQHLLCRLLAPAGLAAPELGN